VGLFWVGGQMTTAEAIELIEKHWPKEDMQNLDPRDYIQLAKDIKAQLEQNETCNCENKLPNGKCHDKFGDEIPIIDYDDGFDIGW
jgi:hypothetical protein